MTLSNLRFNVWRSFVTMATNLPSCFFIPFLEQLLKFLVNFTLLKYVTSQRSYGFLNHKRADFWLPNFVFKRSLLSLLKCCIFEVFAKTFDCFGVRFVLLFWKEKPNFQNGQKSQKNRTNMNMILLFLAKPLDKHGVRQVHITYTPLFLISHELEFTDISTR